jgi:hypothetical protein
MPDYSLRVGLDGTKYELGARVIQRASQALGMSAREATSNVSRLKGTLDQIGWSAASIKSQILATAAGFSLFNLAREAIVKLGQAFRFAFEAVDDFRTHVTMAAAVAMTFMQKPAGETLAQSWKRANEYAKDMIPTIELISAQMVMTGRQATLLMVELMKGGIFLNAQNKEAVAGFQALGNAISILTAGQDPERQIMTEVRALITGQAQAGSMLMRMLEVLDKGQLKEHMKEWRDHKTTLQEVNKLLTGFSEASNVLQGLWKALSTTINTVVTQIVRGGMEKVYLDMIGSVTQLRDYLIESRDVLAVGFQHAVLAIAGVFETIGILIKPFLPAFKEIGRVVAVIAEGLSIVAYAVLPVMAKAITDIWNVMNELLRAASLFFSTIIEGVAALGDAVGQLAKAALQGLTGDIDGAKKTIAGIFDRKPVQDFMADVKELKRTLYEETPDGKKKGLLATFSVENMATRGTGYLDEMVQRYLEMNRKPSTLASGKGGMTPEPEPLPKENDEMLKTKLHIEETYLKNRLAMIKAYGEMELDTIKFQFANGLINDKEYYSAQYRLIQDQYQSRDKYIQEQITKEMSAKAGLKPGTANSEKQALEIDDKIAKLQGEADMNRIESAKQIQTLDHNRLKDAQTYYNYVHQNDELRNEVERTKADRGGDVYSPEQLAIEQKYQKDMDLAYETYLWKRDLNLLTAQDEEKMALIAARREEELATLKKQIWDKSAASAANSLEQIGQAFMTGSKEQFETGKRLSIASTLISTYQGAQAAFTAMAQIPVVGPVLGAAAAAAAILAGLSRVDQIESQTYTARATGGPAVSGQNYLVGEQGPEIIKMGNTSGTVVSNHALARAEQDQTRAIDSLANSVDANTTVVRKLTDVLDIFSFSVQKMSVYMADQAGVGMKTEYNPETIARLVMNDAFNIFSGYTKILTGDFKGALSAFTDIGKNISKMLFGSGTWHFTGAGLSMNYNEKQGATGYQYYMSEKSGGLLGGGKSSTSALNLDPAFVKDLNNAISGMKDTVRTAATILGSFTEDLFKVKTSDIINLFGLSSDQAQKAIESWLKKIGSSMAKGIEGLSDMKVRGETLFDTLIRVATELQTFNDSMLLIGGTMLESSVDSAKFADSLVGAMGGLENFANSTSKFFETFYTDHEQESQKAALASGRLMEAFNSLGIMMPRTAQSYRDLVTGLDLTTDAGQKAYAMLVSMSETANDFYSYTEKMKQARQDMANDLTSRAMRAQGMETEADLYDLRIRQAKELEDAQKNGLETQELMRVQALEYAKALKDAASSIADSIWILVNGTRRSLNEILSTQDSILKAIISIKGGDLGNLSPEEKYKQTKTAFEAASPENMAETAQAFLEASRFYYASGSKYQEDLKGVLDKLGTESGLGTDPTLEAAYAQTDLLTDIKDLMAEGNNVQIEELLNTSKLVDVGSALYQGMMAYVEAVRQLQEQANAVVLQLPDSFDVLNMIPTIINDGMMHIADSVSSIAVSQDTATQTTNTILQTVAPVLTGSIFAMRRNLFGSYAVGTPSVPQTGPYELHYNEAVVDAKSNEVLQKYGIRVMTANNETKDLKEQNKLLQETIVHLKELVRLTRTGVSKSVEFNEKQARSLDSMERSARMATLK